VAAGILEREEVEQAQRDLPEQVFKELYLAEPQEDGSNPFGYDHIANCIKLLSGKPSEFFGIDLAKSKDWTVIIGLDGECNISHFERFQKDWKQTRERIIEVVGLKRAMIDATGVGDPIVEDISRECPYAEGFKYTSQSKQQLIEGLALAIQRGEIGLIDGILKDELEAFEFTYKGGNVKYEAPQGFTDDCVNALALANRIKQCKIDGKEYHIKQSWAEFTYDEYCDIINAVELPPVERLSKFTNIPIDVLNKCTSPQLAVLFEAVGWIESYEDCLLFCKDYKDELSIAKGTYGQLEQAKVQLQLHKDKPLLALSGIVELYYGEKISDKPCVDCLGKGLFVLTKIEEFLKGYQELYEYEPTNEEIEAGVEDLAKLGAFYTVKKMSEKFGKHPDEILKWEAGVVYAFLKADAIDARINKNLQKIYARKK
jgi:hypothetical protein